MDEQIHFSISKTKAKYSIAFIVMIVLVNIFSFRLGQNRSNFSDPIKKIQPPIISDNYTKVDLKELFNNIELYSGQKVVVEGFFTTFRNQCTLRFCYDNPCCNDCYSMIRLTPSDSWDSTESELTLYKKKEYGGYMECKGMDCDIKCDINFEYQRGNIFQEISINKFEVRGEVISVVSPIEEHPAPPPEYGLFVESYKSI